MAVSPNDMLFTELLLCICYIMNSHLERLRSILQGSNSMYFLSSKIRLIMGFRTSCRYSIPTAWHTPNPLTNIHTFWDKHNIIFQMKMHTHLHELLHSFRGQRVGPEECIWICYWGETENNFCSCFSTIMFLQSLCLLSMHRYSTTTVIHTTKYAYNCAKLNLSIIKSIKKLFI